MTRHARQQLLDDVERHLHPAVGAVVDALRAGQKSGAFSKEFRPELILMLILGAGSHPFDGRP